jgi:hypothetical protein
MKHLFRFRFTAADRERYGDGTYELDVAPEGLGRVPMGLLERFEDETGMRVLGDWLDRLGRNELRAMRAFMWLAWLNSNPPTPVPFADFQPDVVGVVGSADFEYIGDAEGNAPSPAPNRATRRAKKTTTATSRSQSASSSRKPPATRPSGS